MEASDIVPSVLIAGVFAVWGAPKVREWTQHKVHDLTQQQTAKLIADITAQYPEDAARMLAGMGVPLPPAVPHTP